MAEDNLISPMTTLPTPAYLPKTPLYILIPPSPLFAAHWSLFLPDLLPWNGNSYRREESNKGRRIHVAGDRLNGFMLEIIRDYDIREHRVVGTRKFLIAFVLSHSLIPDTSTTTEDSSGFKLKDEDEGGGFIDNRPVDDFERVCVGVDAPGPSLNPVRASALPGTGKARPTEVKDCQWWILKVVEKLTELDVLESCAGPGTDGIVKSPATIVAQLPRH